MSGQIILPNAGSPFPSRTTIPVDGDPANAASVATAFTDLLNGVDRARAGLYGAKLRPRYYISDPGPAAPKMVIQPLGTVVVTGSGGVWYSVPHTLPVTVDLVADANGGNNLLVKTRYYLYAYLSGGGLAYTVDVNGPESTLRYAQAGHGGTDLAYVGTFLTHPNIQNSVFVCHESGGIHLNVDNPWAALTNGHANIPTAVPIRTQSSVGNAVPSYASAIILGVYTANVGVADDRLDLAPDSAVANPVYEAVLPANSTRAVQIHMIMLTGSVYYNWQVGGADSSLTLHVMGWLDPR